MFLWRSLRPDALTLLLRLLAARDRASDAPAAPRADGTGPARPSQGGGLAAEARPPLRTPPG